MRGFHKAIFIPAIAAVMIGAGFLIWQTVIAAPAISFGAPGAVHFKDQTITSGSEPLLCFDSVEWHRLCSGTAFTRLTPANVLDRTARTVDIEPHTISTPTATGKLPPKCRATKIPAGLAAGIWKLSGHAVNVCAVPVLGNVTVTSLLPDATVVIRAP